ncbi:Mur ligase family protein [Streptomyces sp. NBC_01571]|uniref:Mur ligase domain-containing protein n=1 Tax=Streptomyces sp. NBC_01571 TaxID=2975883 RepID=UPI0022594CCE|nr:Mur ligase domain-containing protein [Streptomyces sp. NBC_01571]MCX4581285.1 Mur ligase family protein [Streptomyces sp. NBC_01571]
MPDTLRPLAGRHVHFNGIGGKGIAPAAALAHQAQMRVTGDDLEPNHRTHAFAAEGINVTLGTNTVPEGAEYLVATGALPRQSSGPQPMARLEFVQHLLAAHDKKLIAVAGSLGKSTAAALLHQILSPLDPSAYIGADVPGLFCGGQLAAGEWAVVEACEYQGAYRALTPEIVIALNLVQNHEDLFGPGTAGFERSLAAFLTETSTPPSMVVLPDDVAALLTPRLTGTAGMTVQTVGEDADWNVDVTSIDPTGTTFRLAQHGTYAGTWTVPAPGRHLVTAAACSLVTSLHLGVSHADSAEALVGFRLPRRRMSTMHHDDRLVLVDDNARQPGQAAALLQALRQAHPDRHLVIAVAPWGRKNRRDLAAWALGLSEADTVWILPVGDAAVPGGEAPDADARLAELIRLEGTPAYTVRPDGDLPLPAGPDTTALLVATAGYDGSLKTFSALHDQTIARFGADPAPAA